MPRYARGPGRALSRNRARSGPGIAMPSQWACHASATPALSFRALLRPAPRSANGPMATDGPRSRTVPLTHCGLRHGLRPIKGIRHKTGRGRGGAAPRTRQENRAPPPGGGSQFLSIPFCLFPSVGFRYQIDTDPQQQPRCLLPMAKIQMVILEAGGAGRGGGHGQPCTVKKILGFPSKSSATLHPSKWTWNLVVTWTWFWQSLDLESRVISTDKNRVPLGIPSSTCFSSGQDWTRYS